MKKVLYTIDAFPDGAVEKESWFDRVATPRNKHYCARCNADYEHIKVDEIVHSPAHYHKLDVFRKFLESDYDRGIFFDMDIHVEDACPDLWLENGGHGVCMVFDYLMMIKTNYEPWCNSTWPGAKPQIKYDGITKWTPPNGEDIGQTVVPWRYFNTGVIVFDREFAEFLLENIVKVNYPDGREAWPDGWGEQHYFNFAMDYLNYPVNELPRKANEMTGLTQNEGEWISHYPAPWGKSFMAQREIHPDQASFQRKYVKGEVINIGCNTDYAKLKQDFGALNVDLFDVDPKTNLPLQIDLKCDGRHLPADFGGKYDTVVLGEILEHMEPEARKAQLTEAMRVSKDNAWIIISCPFDDRDMEEPLEVAPGCYHNHTLGMTQSQLEESIKDAGLKIHRREKIKYPFDEVEGMGYVVLKPDYWQKVMSNHELLFNTE
jgi:hypothetical protein